MTTQLAPAERKDNLTRRGRDFFPFDDFPFPFGRLRNELDRLFDRFGREFSTLAGPNGDSWRWGLTVDDQPDTLIVRAEAPGFDASDFDVRVEDHRLTLRASKKVETKGDKGKTEEYREQECYQSVALPSGIDKDKIAATYRNGILTVTIPKTAEGKAKQIAVKGS